MNIPLDHHPVVSLPIIDGMAKTTNCPLCGKRMLRYENPDRMLCPNYKAHDARLARERVPGYASPQVPTGNGSTKKN